MNSSKFIRAAILGVALTALGTSAAAQTLLNVSYDPTRELYEDFNVFEQLFHAEEGWVSATSENMSLHVDMQSKKTAAFPPGVAACLARMKAAPPVFQIRRESSSS